MREIKPNPPKPAPAILEYRVVQGGRTAITLRTPDRAKALDIALRFIRMASGEGSMTMEMRDPVTGVFAAFDPTADEAPTPLPDDVEIH